MMTPEQERIDAASHAPACLADVDGFPCARNLGHWGEHTPNERLHELTETGRSVRYTGRPIMTMIAEALEGTANGTFRPTED